MKPALLLETVGAVMAKIQSSTLAECVSAPQFPALLWGCKGHDACIDILM